MNYFDIDLQAFHSLEILDCKQKGLTLQIKILLFTKPQQAAKCIRNMRRLLHKLALYTRSADRFI